MLLHLMHDVPLWATALLVTVGAAVYSIGLMLVTRTIFGVDRLSRNNEVAGFKFAVVGVFYAVMLAFIVIAVWEDFRKTEAAVRDEAKAIVDLHRVTFALPAAGGADIRKHLTTYTNDVRKYEWPTMAVGEPSDVVVKDLDRLSRAIFDVNPQSWQELALYQDALRLLAVMTDNRTERLDSAGGSMPGVLWFVLIVGGLITLGYPAFFGSTNLVAQILMTAALAELVALAMLLGLAFDYPFTGEVHISAHPFDQALRQMPENWPPP
jgi:ABC-type amino acid transport system permease subunit